MAVLEHKRPGWKDEISESQKPLGETMSFPSRGIIYIVTGKKFVEEACRSAASVKQCMSDIPITICSDVPLNSSLFDQVMPIANPMYGLEDKILNIAKSPYQETLFLDSDTYMADDSRELFLLLERFDFAAVHSSCRAQYQVSEVPACFPEFNMGVLLFRKSDHMESLLERWIQIYREDGVESLTWQLPGVANWYRHALPDQPSFRRAIYESSLRIATLPPEYNCRFPFPGFVQAKVKIIHGRVHSFAKISDELNKTMLPRVHLMRWGKLKMLDSAMPTEDTILARTRWSLHHRGFLKTARTTMTQFMTKLGRMFE
jgi:hypothetical protein